MANDNGKISVRQALLLFIVTFCAPAIRYIPIFTSEQAKQAAWIAPLVAVIFEIIYMFVWCGFLKKYDKKSFVEIIKYILGNIFGNIVIFMYFIWITVLLTYNLRMYAERIAGTAMPAVSVILILLTMLLLVGYVVKNGIISLAKMNELFFIALTGIFVLYNILVLPKLHFDNLFPLTYKDIFPVFKANFGILTIFSYNILIFMFNDKIEHKGEFKKLAMKTIGVLTIVSILVIAIPISVFGWSILVKMPIPYLNSMMQIQLFDIIERVESGLIMFWIITDFMIIAVFTYSALHMIKLTFNLKNIRPLLYIYLVGIFFLSLILARSSLELRILSKNILTPWTLVMGYVVPILIFIVGKIRKKV